MSAEEVEVSEEGKTAEERGFLGEVGAHSLLTKGGLFPPLGSRRSPGSLPVDTLCCLSPHCSLFPPAPPGGSSEVGNVQAGRRRARAGPTSPHLGTPAKATTTLPASSSPPVAFGKGTRRRRGRGGIRGRRTTGGVSGRRSMSEEPVLVEASQMANQVFGRPPRHSPLAVSKGLEVS